MGACWPVATTGEKTHSIVHTPHILTVPTPALSARLKSMVVWDIKTGTIIKDIVISVWGIRRVVFSEYYTVTLITDFCKVFRTYDVLNGALLCEGEILPPPDRWLGAHWENGESLRFATGYMNNGTLAIDIHQLQPSSTPLLPIVESFVVPPQNGEFSFSPVSFHASFVTDTEITLLDVRDSKTLLRTEAPQPLYLLPGRFSLDGGFFACGTLEGEIRIWKNAPAGYAPWSGLKPRLPFDSFSFSPTATSILAWGPGGVQLLDNHTRVPSPSKEVSNRDSGDHLLAYSKDGTRIATARRGNNVVTIFDPLSDTPQRSINTAMRILDIGIVGNTIFTADMREIVGWDLGVGKVVHRAVGATAVTGTNPDVTAEHFTLSTDCSWTAFAINRTIFLYDIQGRRVVYKRTMGRDITNIRFAPHGRQLWFTLENRVSDRGIALSEMVEQWRIVDMTREFEEDLWSRGSLFLFNGCCIQRGSGWIEDYGGRKLLWLPPSWRLTYRLDARWNGNYLALVDGRHPVPVNITFQHNSSLIIPPTHQVPNASSQS